MGTWRGYVTRRFAFATALLSRSHAWLKERCGYLGCWQIYGPTSDLQSGHHESKARDVAPPCHGGGAFAESSRSPDFFCCRHVRTFPATGFLGSLFSVSRSAGIRNTDGGNRFSPLRALSTMARHIALGRSTVAGCRTVHRCCSVSGSLCGN